MNPTETPASILEKRIRTCATIKRRKWLVLSIVMSFLWFISVLYIIYLSTRHPTDSFYIVLSAAVTSEGIGSTAVVFLKLNKTWDQLFFPIFNEQTLSVFSNEAERTEQLRMYFTKISDPLKVRNRKMANDDLHAFCEGVPWDSFTGQSDYANTNKLSSKVRFGFRCFFCSHSVKDRGMKS